MTDEIESGLDRDGIGLDLQQLISRLELLVDAARRLDVTLSERSDHLSQLEEPEDEVVDPRAEVEVGLTEDAPALGEVVVRLFDRPDVDRPVVRRGDNQETVYTELVRFTRKADEGSVAGDDSPAPARHVDGDPEDVEPLVVAEDGALSGLPRHDEPIGTTLDEVLREFAEALDIDSSAEPERPDDRS